MPDSPKARMDAISEQGLCLGCGLCAAVTGPELIRFHKTDIGEERPVVVGELSESMVDAIYRLCPGVHVEGLPENLLSEETQWDQVWGPYVQMVHAWAADETARYEGATGGVLTALAHFLLASKKVDFVLHSKAHDKEPNFGQATISETPEQVLSAAGSRYGPTATLVDIHSVLERGQSFAFIGKPCDVAALRNLAKQDERVDQQVKYMLTMVCGGYLPTKGYLNFLKREGLEKEAITAVRYRGQGCPGPTQVETEHGIQHFDYIDLWGTDETQWVLPFRCKICPDGIGEAADIAAADTWLGGSPERGVSDKDPGINAVVVRTEQGRELLAQATEQGFLAVGEGLKPELLSEYQPHQRNKKYAAAARHRGLEKSGRIVPNTERLRIHALSAKMSAEFNRLQTEGTMRRIASDKASEPTPAFFKD